MEKKNASETPDFSNIPDIFSIKPIYCTYVWKVNRTVDDW